MVTAFVLMSVPPKRSAEVVEALRKYPEVLEAAAVYGDTDVVAKVEASSLLDIDRVIMYGIQEQVNVTATRTYLTIEKLHWKR